MEVRTMKVSLIRLASLAMLLCLSSFAYSKDDESKTQRKSNGSKERPVENASVKTSRNEEVRKEDQDGQYWFNKGYSLHQSDHYIEAIEAFTQAISFRYRQATCMYNVACG